jgi:hypothetical protein
VFSLISAAFVSVHLHTTCEASPHFTTNLLSYGFLLGSREQNYRPEDCGICHSVLIGKKGSGFWEGGKGMSNLSASLLLQVFPRLSTGPCGYWSSLRFAKMPGRPCFSQPFDRPKTRSKRPDNQPFNLGTESQEKRPVFANPWFHSNRIV